MEDLEESYAGAWQIATDARNLNFLAGRPICRGRICLHPLTQLVFKLFQLRCVVLKLRVEYGYRVPLTQVIQNTCSPSQTQIVAVRRQ